MKQNHKFDRRRLGVTGCLISVIIVAGGIAVFYTSRAKAAEQSENIQKETQVKRGDLTVGVTESGTVEVGTITQNLEELENLSGGDNPSDASDGNDGMSGSSTSAVSLEVEEIYLTAGQKVSVGDPVLKLTKESVEEYRKELEEAVRTAELALEKAQYEVKAEKLSAAYTYNSNVAEGSVAQSEYEAAIAELQASVDAAQAQVDASAAKIADYQGRISKGEECRAALAEEQANYNSLVSKLQSAQNNQTTKAVEAKEKYEKAMLNYNNADSLYQINTSGIDTEVKEAQDTYEDAGELLQNFQALIGDGIIYAQYAGTVASLGYEKGDELSASTEMVSYTDASDITMTVSVSQEDIASVELKDQVKIALTAYEDETFEGEVKSIDTSSSSGTSTVSYNVTVVFTGDTSKVYQDMTGNVTFISAEAEDVCYVSRKAVIQDKDTAYVKVKRKDGTIEETEVVTGITDGINIEIRSGLEEGDTVVIESQGRMQ